MRRIGWTLLITRLGTSRWCAVTRRKLSAHGCAFSVHVSLYSGVATLQQTGHHLGQIGLATYEE